jgi:hypothetical protein
VLIAQRPTLAEEPISEFRSRFVIEPLEPGFGYTLGNSLRRTLLSSIPGASVTSLRIEGVLHEFTTVPGVKEDVTENDIVEVRAGSVEMTPFVIARATAGERPVPAWLEVIPNQMRILVHALPARQVIDTPVQEQLIVELYSK